MSGRVPYVVARALLLIIEDLARAHHAKDPRNLRELQEIAAELEGYEYLDHPEVEQLRKELAAARSGRPLVDREALRRVDAFLEDPTGGDETLL